MNEQGENQLKSLVSAWSSKEASRTEFAVMVGRLLKFLKEKMSDCSELPKGCRVYPSGEFVYEIQVDTGGRMGTRRILHITADLTITNQELLEFERLIAHGFIEELIAGLNEQQKKFEEAKKRIHLL